LQSFTLATRVLFKECKLFAAGHAVLGRREDMCCRPVGVITWPFFKKKIFTRKVTFVAFIKSGDYMSL